jgi:hypothetical protein
MQGFHGGFIIKLPARCEPARQVLVVAEYLETAQWQRASEARSDTMC